ncbi:MAG: hypothetical protein E7F24_10910, partial [Veillonella sp.]|nr:hypothetical protein [Veillonella sp.]
GYHLGNGWYFISSVGALVHNGGSLLVVANSALLLRWAYKSNYIVDDDHSVLMNAARKRVFEA